MKSIKLFIFLLLSVHTNYGKGKKIFYTFPDSLSIKINSIIEKVESEKDFTHTKKTLTYIKIGAIFDTSLISIYHYNMTSSKEREGNKELNTIIKLTNRYYKSNGKLIPIILDADFIYSSVLNQDKTNKGRYFPISYFDCLITIKGYYVEDKYRYKILCNSLLEKNKD